MPHERHTYVGEAARCGHTHTYTHSRGYLGEPRSDGGNVLALVVQPRVLQGVGEGQAILEPHQVLILRLLPFTRALRALIAEGVPQAAGNAVVIAVVPQVGPQSRGAVRGRQPQAEASHGASVLVPLDVFPVLNPCPSPIGGHGS